MLADFWNPTGFINAPIHAENSKKRYPEINNLYAPASSGKSPIRLRTLICSCVLEIIGRAFPRLIPYENVN